MCYMQLAEMKYMRDDEELNYAFFNFPAVEDGKGDPGQLTGAPGRHDDLRNRQA